jgi:Flp pilus assembly protein TadG
VNHRFTSRATNESGTAALELALLLPIMVAVLFGTVEVARMYHAWETLTHAAREAARPLALKTGDPAVTMQNNVPGLDPSKVIMTRTPALGDCTLGSTVTITLTYPIFYNIPFAPPGRKDITGKASMRCGG